MLQGSERRGLRANRTGFLILSLLIAGGLILASAAGLLSPFEGIASAPLETVSGFFARFGRALNDNITRFNDMQALQQRIADLETALALYQEELVELREKASDYDRLTSLLDYVQTARNQEFVTADVIGNDQTALLRTIIINRGTRDGIAAGMPVVTGQGLVGRVIQVSANASRVLLISDPSSSVSARLQNTRDEGAVVGQTSGTLLMEFIPLDSQLRDGELVITSGLGGNFPPDLVLGQVTNVRLAPSGLYQIAQMRSLVSLDTLEFVLVITDFQPVDLGAFEE
ncbi:MAG: rod shape-determining protein MreC [Anaerolineae bacterium]|nr:rod shape-determining protein MreC [Anaerolineae bacterium]NUQ03444.1 rod shape-determining protein MreC [Anaerolineae bacterium]